jgi:uncharacterized protein
VRQVATILLLVCTWASTARVAVAIPTDELLRSLRPTADVNDYAGLLTPAEKTALEERCRQLREKTGAELAVVTLPSLEGGDIQDFANKLFQRWGIGQKGKNNGLLLIVAMQERKSWIEVGYGLEPIVPDVLAGRIIDHQLLPRFREQQYAAGLRDAVGALAELVERGEPADVEALKGDDSDAALAMLVFILAAGVGAGGIAFGSGLATRAAAAIVFGLGLALVPAAIGALVAWPLAPLVHLPVALIGAWLGWYGAKHGGPRGPGGRRRANSWPAGWNWGSIPVSGGDWSSGGGGFSQSWGGFGGGSSGGGGAGGSW